MPRELIALAGRPRFGNLTFGGGLNAVFDDAPNTTAWRETAPGYAGISFAPPIKIDSVDVLSSGNGFDASWSTTQITLRLYAKQGTAPTHDADGTLLAGLGPFTDVNSQQTYTIESTDKTTLWDHVWVKVSTGVWSVFADVRFYTLVQSPPVEPPVDPPAPQAGDLLFLKAENRQNTEIPWELYPLLLEATFRVDVPTWVTAEVNVMYEHKGVSLGGSEYPIGCSTRVGLLGPYEDVADIPATPASDSARKALMASSAITWLDRRGGNINGVSDHYFAGRATAQIKLTALGYYRAFGAATARTSLAPNQDGLVRLTNNDLADPPTNKLDVRLEA